MGVVARMPRRKTEAKSRLPIELRLLWWLVKLVWRLPVWILALVGLVLWLLAWPLRRQGEVALAWPSADAFYGSHPWRRARIDALEANRDRCGVLTCECCQSRSASQWHVDHIRPRSSHPDSP